MQPVKAGGWRSRRILASAISDLALRAQRATSRPGGRADAALAPSERLPSWLFNAPIAARVLWRGLAHGHPSLPALANPLAKEGGVMGSSKSRIFAQLSPQARRWVAPWAAIDSLGAPGAASTFFYALSRMETADLDFPLVAKPDRGARGQGVRVLADEGDLRDYVVAFPAGQRFLLQQLVDHEHEAGIMYARHPAEAEGRVISLALKEPPDVIGDGSATLRDLIARHPRARYHRRHALARHRDRLDEVPARGERVELVFTRSHCAGAVCRDARHLVTPELSRRIDAIARSIPGFNVGRFDVRFASPSELQAGTKFTIVEINGAASEPLHAWDPGNSILQAWRAYFEQVDLLFELGAANRAAGHASIPGSTG